MAKRNKGERWRIAIHEAGHTVAALLFKEQFEYVTIIDDESRQSKGHIKLVHPRTPSTGEPLEKRIMYKLAGGAAERAFFGGQNKTGCAPDEKDATDDARLIDLTAPSGHVERLRKCIDDRFSGQATREAINGIAKSLINHGTLAEGACRGILDTADSP